jgi:hypothetical protein
MTSLKGMDELFWGREFEDVHDWVEGLEMATKVHRIDELKLFKIGKLNLQCKSNEWFKKLMATPHKLASHESSHVAKIWYN